MKISNDKLLEARYEGLRAAMALKALERVLNDTGGSGIASEVTFVRVKMSAINAALQETKAISHE